MSSSQSRTSRAARKEAMQPDVPLRTSDYSGTPLPSLSNRAVATAAKGDMANEKSSFPDPSVLQLMQEARDIVAGRLDAPPTKAHLEAVLLSAMFYKAKATTLEEQQYSFQQLADHRRGEMVHIPELESNCYQCQTRAQYLVVGLIVPVLFCPLHAAQQPQWNRMLMTGRVQ